MKNNIFRGILVLFFLIYLILVFAVKFGYYESKETKVKTLTEEQVLKFEEDIKNGKEVDIEKYIVDEVTDYTSPLSNGIYSASLKMESIIDKTVRIVFNTSEKMVTD